MKQQFELTPEEVQLIIVNHLNENLVQEISPNEVCFEIRDDLLQSVTIKNER